MSNLWIRSQDKEALKKVNMGVMYWKDINDRNCIVNINNATGYSIMGVYQTKERVIEVLDTIQNLLMPTIIYEPIVEENKNPKLSTKIFNQVETNIEIKELNTFVFEMPKE